MGATISLDAWRRFWQGVDQTSESTARSQFAARGYEWPSRPVRETWSLRNFWYYVPFIGEFWREETGSLIVPNRGVYWEDVWERRPLLGDSGVVFESTQLERGIVEFDNARLEAQSEFWQKIGKPLLLIGILLAALYVVSLSLRK